LISVIGGARSRLAGVVRKILLDTGTRGEYRALILVGASTECLERAVPRYFLDLVDGDQRTIDRTGIIADDLECAEHTAEGAARDFMVSKLLRDEDPDGRRYEIVDKANRVLATVCFRDLLPKPIAKEWEAEVDDIPLQRNRH
jgi:hypothetical protein